jgi:hypothetical protein
MKQAGRASVQRNMSATRAATPARGTTDTPKPKAVADGTVAEGGAPACEKMWSAGQRHGEGDIEGTQSSRNVDEWEGVMIVGSTSAPIG